MELDADLIARLLDDAPLLVVAYVAFIRPVHKRLFERLDRLERRQRRLLEADASIELTGTHAIPPDRDSVTPTTF